MPYQPTRRQFLNHAASAAVLAQTALSGEAFAKTAGREALQEFPYSDVELTGGPLKAQYDFIHAHFLSLDNDRLLQPYRQHAGLPAPGKEMGGWYGHDGFVAGHTLGQYISGLARIGATTGDETCHEKVRYLISEFARTLAANPNPYAGESAQKLWAAYVLDKHEIGLIDAYRLSGMQEAAELLPKVIAGAKPFVSPESRDRIGKKDPPYDETYVLSENLFATAAVTGDKTYRDMAVHYLLNKEFYDPLAKGIDALPGKHAYSHAISLSSAAAAYLELGDEKYKRALVNAWNFLELQRYASGGWGPEEQFVTPHTGALYASLSSTKAHFETPCGAYANMKLARYLLRFTGEAKYGDGLERDIFNTMLAARNPDGDGGYPYYSTYSPGARKEYYHMKWPCCSGTLVQGVADYVLGLYFHAADELTINMYAPSRVKWAANGVPVIVEQQTLYPSTDTIVVRVSPASPARFALRLRIPAWASRANLTVNGRPEKAPVAGSFATVVREWQIGDTVELTLPQSLRTQPIDDKHPDVVALLKGPVMYVALDGAADPKTKTISGPAELKPLAGRAQAYRKAGAGQDMIFVPYYQIADQTYDTYFKMA